MRKRLWFRIKSKIEAIYSVEERILNTAEAFGFNSDHCFALRLALDEALLNAIIHGNGRSEEKEIQITAHFDSDLIQICVQDEGNGFDRSQLTDPREEPYLRKQHGRGIFLIRQFTHELKFNDKGNRITFCIERAKTTAVINSR